jgi:hypothetical protein
MNQLILKDPRKKLQKIEQKPEGYCVHARKLGAYVDDPKIMRESVGLNDHLKKCTDCQESLKELRDFYDLVERNIPQFKLEDQRRYQIMLELKELYKTPVFKALDINNKSEYGDFKDKMRFINDALNDLVHTLVSPPMVLMGTFMAIMIWTYKFFS